MTLREIILKITNNNSLNIYLGKYDELDHEVYFSSGDPEMNYIRVDSAQLDRDGDIILEISK